ncbi:MAG TPA: delta-60 repeat domain-containing protein, partial [Solirubrobacterales bacterium]|nr:delta-60 repeat domain-containing protein [Solirubrobacterales bacterium]
SSGKVVLAGFSHGRPALVQLLADGRPDPSFGNHGRVVAPSSLRGEATALSLGGKGRTLIGCRCSRSGSRTSVLAVLRYTAAGKLDPGFSKATLQRSVPKRLRPDFLLRTGDEIVVVGTGAGPLIRLFDGHGRSAAPSAGVPGVPHDRAFGVFAALQQGKPLVAWTPQHGAGQAELRLERLVLAPAG